MLPSVNLDSFAWLRRSLEERFNKRFTHHRGLAARVAAATPRGGCSVLGWNPITCVSRVDPAGRWWAMPVCIGTHGVARAWTRQVSTPRTLPMRSTGDSPAAPPRRKRWRGTTTSAMHTAWNATITRSRWRAICGPSAPPDSVAGQAFPGSAAMHWLCVHSGAAPNLPACTNGADGARQLAGRAAYHAAFDLTQIIAKRYGAPHGVVEATGRGTGHQCSAQVG